MNESRWPYLSRLRVRSLRKFPSAFKSGYIFFMRYYALFLFLLINEHFATSFDKFPPFWGDEVSIPPPTNFLSTSRHVRDSHSSRPRALFSDPNSDTSKEP